MVSSLLLTCLSYNNNFTHSLVKSVHPFPCFISSFFSNWLIGGSFLQHPSNLTAPCNAVCRVRADRDGNVGRGDSQFSCPLASDYNPVCWESLTDEGGNSYKKRQMSFLNPCLAGCSGQSYQIDENGKTIEVSFVIAQLTTFVKFGSSMLLQCLEDYFSAAVIYIFTRCHWTTLNSD